MLDAASVSLLCIVAMSIALRLASFMRVSSKSLELTRVVPESQSEQGHLQCLEH